MDNSIKFNGDKLFQYRKQKKLSQEKLALAIGVSRQTIYLWESNQSVPDIEKVSKICKVLEINVSDLMIGIDEDTTNSKGKEENKKTDIQEEKLKSKHKKRLVKLIIVFLSLIVLCYLLITTIKIAKLNGILNKWKKLDEVESYYIRAQEYLVERSNNKNDTFENVFYEMYYNHNVLKTVWKDVKNEKIKNIMIYDYNQKKRYIIYEEEGTYSIEKIDKNKEIEPLTSIFRKYGWISYGMCFYLNFDIMEKRGIYEINVNDYVKKYINKETGLLEYEEILDNSFRQTRTYYTIELNTEKDFAINLEEYTEVTQ